MVGLDLGARLTKVSSKSRRGQDCSRRKRFTSARTTRQVRGAFENFIQLRGKRVVRKAPSQPIPQPLPSATPSKTDTRTRALARVQMHCIVKAGVLSMDKLCAGHRTCEERERYLRRLRGAWQDFNTRPCGESQASLTRPMFRRCNY